MKTHTRISPSGFSRVIACPGSVALSDKCPKGKDSVDSATGTAAHAVGEKCLLSWQNASDWLGKLAPESDIVVDKAMADAVQVYLDEVRSNLGNEKTLFVEQKLDLSWLIPNCKGSSDAVILDKKEKTLYVYDYKNGVGVEVEVEWNAQMLGYAIGAIHAFKKEDIEDVHLIIVQPNLPYEQDRIKKWSISKNDLLFWANNVLKPCIQEAESKTARLAVGSHCRFCPALAVCPKQIEHALTIAKTDFDNPILPDPGSLTPEEIVKVMNVSEVFHNWANSVVQYAQSQAEAGIRLPGYKLVKRKSNRKWINEIEAELALSSVLGDDAYKKTVITVKQAEDKFKALKLDDSILQSNIDKPDNGLSLVPSTDERQEVISTTALEFLDDADFLK